MTKSQKADLKRSEIREKLNVAQAAAEPDRAEVERLSGELATAEQEYRAAVTEEAKVAETPGADDPETRELLELRGRAKTHRYFTAAATERPIDGAEAEYAAAEKCAGMLPVRLLFGSPPAPAAETRAAATVAAGAVAENPMPTAGEVFVSPLAARLGVRTPVVAAGTAAFPYISTGATAAAVGEGSNISDSSPAISAKTVDPGRVGASVQMQREDMAKLADMDSALSMNITEALRNRFDQQMVGGNGTSPNLNGLLTQRAPTAPTTNDVTTFAQLIAGVQGYVDGTYAERFEDVTLVTSPRVASYLAGMLLTTNVRQDSALSWLRGLYSGEFVISGQAPVVARINHATAGNRRAGGAGVWGIRRRINPLAYAPIWSGVELIRDIYSGAKGGVVTLTATLICGGVAVLRPDAFVVTMVATEQGTAP